MANWSYDPNVDYMALMKAADAAGNKELAAIYEQQRNAKIRGSGLEQQYPTTTNYAAYLPKATGESGGTAGAGLAELNQKISALGKESFSYNPETDPSMQAYRQAYLREADRNVRDVMGAHAGMTQGVPSSAAITAASQAGDYYRTQLTDKIPELESQAYSRWLNGQQQQMQQLQLQQDSYSTMISDAMSRWAALGRADEYVSQVLGVPVGTTTADQAYTDYQISADKKNNLMQLMAAGYTPDDNELSAAGMSRREADAWQGYLAAQQSSGGSGGGSTGMLIDWDKRKELAAAYEQGGIGAIDDELDYLEKKGYDMDELMGWLGAYYATEGSFDGGYNGTQYGKTKNSTSPRTPTVMLN